MYTSFPVAFNQLSFFVKVRQSIANPKFSYQLALVTWLTDWLTGFAEMARVMLGAIRRNPVTEHLSLCTRKAACCTLTAGTQRESWMLA